MVQPKSPLSVFYDGACSICAREIDYYRKLDGEGHLRLVDISDPSFEPSNHGPTREDFMAELHVRDASGHFFRGVDGFAAIWRVVPGRPFRMMARLIQIPGIHFLATLGYRVFARLRKYLPSREGGCADGSCGLGHPRRDK